MNRRQLLKLGALAVVAPKAMAAPVEPTLMPMAPNPMLAHIEALRARAFAAAGINGGGAALYRSSSIAMECYQEALAKQILLVATKMSSEGRLFRSAPVPVTVLP